MNLPYCQRARWRFYNNYNIIFKLYVHVVCRNNKFQSQNDNIELPARYYLKPFFYSSRHFVRIRVPSVFSSLFVYFIFRFAKIPIVQIFLFSIYKLARYLYIRIPFSLDN